LLKNANKQKLIEAISNEVGGIIGAKDVEKLYDYAMTFPFGSLVINTHPKENIKFRMGWSKQLTLDDMPCDCVSRNKPFGSCGKTS
jgi:hypothetical protein